MKFAEEKNSVQKNLETRKKSLFYEDALLNTDAINDLRRKASQDELLTYLRLDVLKNLYFYDRMRSVDYVRRAKAAMDELLKEARLLEEKKAREAAAKY